MPCVSPRLAPALGLAAACTMLTGVGIIAISLGHTPAQPTEIAGAVLVPSPTTTPSASTTARQAKSSRTSRSTPTPTPPSTVATYSNPPVAVSSSAAVPSQPATSPSVVHSSTATPPPTSSTVSAMTPTLRTASTATADQYAQAAQAVFQAVNRARAAHHLPALLWSGNLQTSAHRHNSAMAAHDTLSHQVSGEPALGPRESAAGVQWTYAAENIGWTTDRSVHGALDIEARMYGEKAPNDAHKLNILSTSATSVGIDVYIDAAHGRLWLTEDFSG